MNISELRAKQDTLLNETQRIGLKHFEDLELRIPYSEMEQHQRFLVSELDRLGLHGEITGSFRRGSKDSGDIDLLVTRLNDRSDSEESESESDPEFNLFIESLFAKGYLINKLSQGPYKFGGICRLVEPSTSFPDGKLLGTYRRIDILYSPPHEYPFALLYFTGPKLFNTAMRKKANLLGYSLNEKTLSHLSGEGDEAIWPIDHIFKTEREIMEFLGYSWLEPRDRAIEPKVLQIVSDMNSERVTVNGNDNVVKPKFIIRIK